MDLVADTLIPADFYREAHRKIYQTMLDLYNRHEPVDLVSVNNLLKERNQLEEVGGPLFLTGLSEHVGIAANADYYARVVWEKAQIRKIQEKAAQILNQNHNGNLEEYLTWAESQILEVTTPALNRSRANSFPPIDESIITPISELIKTPPPDRDYLFNGTLPSCLVGGIIAMGGTGKGHLNNMLGLSLATGRDAGPLKPARKFKVLSLAGEDSQEELKRRVFSAVEAFFPDGPPPPEVDNFTPISVMGKLGPLMQLDGDGNPVNAPAYDWLCKTLENLPDVEVLIIDPKSKFYGLDENNNTHCAAWINCLESIVSRFKITVLFSHHESKARAASMEQASSRGGSALTDGCRWVANIKTMDSKTAEKFQVADPHNYVVLEVTKSNYSPKLPGPVYFRRGAGGALSYINLGADRIQGIADRFLNLLAEEEVVGHNFSRRDFLYGKRAKRIIDDLKETAQGFNRLRDINLVVDHLLESGLLREIKVKGKTGPEKTILRVVEAG
jgi:replicative DNA helicase